MAKEFSKTDKTQVNHEAVKKSPANEHILGHIVLAHSPHHNFSPL